jgi:hypothetical protein
MLRLMLAAHRELAVPPEAGFMCWLKDVYVNYSVLDWQKKSTLAALATNIVESRKFETWNLPFDDILSALVSRRPITYAEACESVYWAFARKFKPSASRWGDKNNFHCTQVAALKSMFPHAQFLHIVRDPRDVACSYREVMGLESRSPYRPKLPIECGQIAEEWVNNVNSIERGAKDLPPAQYHVVRYEDLVSAPEQILREICTWLGLDFDRQMLVFNERNKALALEPSATMDWKLRTLDPANTSRIGRHAYDMNVEQRRAVEVVAGETMKHFGYELSVMGKV